MPFRRGSDNAVGEVDSDGPRRGVWIALFVGIFMVCAAWATIAPYNATPDEAEHVLNAYSVADGQIFKAPADAARGTGAYVTVPRSLTDRGHCFLVSSTITAKCTAGPVGSRDLVRDGSVVGRYNPIYYGIVGLPLRADPSWGGLIAARLIGAAMVSAMLTWALYAAVRWSRSRIMVAGILVAMTPTVFELGGAVNPNALEIAAGVALFAGLIPLADPDRPPTRAMVTLVGVAAVELALLRSIGPLWLAGAVFILFVPTARRRLAELWRMVSVRWWSAVIVVASLAGVAWTLAFKSLGVALLQQPPMTRGQIERYAILLPHGGAFGLLQETVGAMGWREFNLPTPVLAGWYAACGLLVLAALCFGTWLDRWRIFAIFAGGFGVAVAATIVTAQDYGFGWQGRYILPLTVGAPIYAAWVLTKRDVLDPHRAGQLIRGVAALVLPLGLIAFWWSQIRWEFGIVAYKAQHLDPFGHALWEPRLGSVLPFALAVLGFATIGWFAWRSSRSGTATGAPAETAEPLTA
jgi:hypothetical protein